MYFTYILKSSKTGRFYIGYSKDIDRRLEKHNAGHSRATKSGIPWQLMWSFENETKTEAIKLENEQIQFSEFFYDDLDRDTFFDELKAK